MPHSSLLTLEHLPVGVASRTGISDFSLGILITGPNSRSLRSFFGPVVEILRDLWISLLPTLTHSVRKLSVKILGLSFVLVTRFAVSCSS